MLIIGRPSRGGCSLFANNGGGPVVSGLLISPWIYALDGETGQSGTRPDTISERSGLSYGLSRCGITGGMLIGFLAQLAGAPFALTLGGLITALFAGGLVLARLGELARATQATALELSGDTHPARRA